MINSKTICFIADARSPHAQKWVRGCEPLKWRIIVISHWPGEVPGAEVIVHPLPLSGFFRYWISFRSLIRKLNPDIIHAHQFGAHGLYAWLSGIKPLLISAWGSDILLNPKKSVINHMLVKWQIRQANLITADSDPVTTELIHLGAPRARILTFNFGIAERLYERLCIATKGNDRLIICSPRFHEPLYNIDTIIKAFFGLVHDYPQVELWIIGDGSMTRELQQYVACHQVPRVRFWGRVSPEHCLDLMAQSDILISIPSSDSTSVSMIEGMAAGCLPILSDLPANRDWVTDGRNGLIVNSDLASLANGLRRSIEDAELRHQAAIINRKLIRERAIWETQFQVMLEKYQRMV